LNKRSPSLVFNFSQIARVKKVKKKQKYFKIDKRNFDKGVAPGKKLKN
jgi:hypothetical protein